MSKLKYSGPATAVAVAPDPASNPDPIKGARSEDVDPSVEKDYWHVNYMTRPYYRQDWSFGDYEAAYRYGWENAPKAGRMTFEEAENAYLATGWTSFRGEMPHSWDDVREAARDAWTRARRKR